MAQYNRNNWHHIPGIGGTMATGLSIYNIQGRKTEKFQHQQL
jgi:hypothetical protein